MLYIIVAALAGFVVATIIFIFPLCCCRGGGGKSKDEEDEDEEDEEGEGEDEEEDEEEAKKGFWAKVCCIFSCLMKANNQIADFNPDDFSFSSSKKDKD